MPGIINQVRPQAQTQPAAQPAQGQPDQQSVERVVVAAVKLIHDPKIAPQLVQLMRAAGDPVKALVDATMLVMKQLWEKSKRSIPGDVLGAAAAQVLKLIGELAQAAKLFQVTPELLQQAAQAGLERLKAEHGGGAAPQPGAAPVAPQAAAPVAQPMMAGG
jgi:hypothetical protein